MDNKQNSSLFSRKILVDASREMFLKLNPKMQVKNPVMFLVYISSVATTLLFVLSLLGISDGIVTSGFIFSVTIILWLTCLFANFAEAIAEGRGKAQAAELKKSKKILLLVNSKI